MTSRVSQQGWNCCAPAAVWPAVERILRCKEPLCVIHRLLLCCAQPVSGGERLGTVLGSPCPGLLARGITRVSGA